MNSPIKRILCIDDSRPICILLTRLFENEGFHCAAAESAAVARDKLKQRAYDLVIVDAQMPVIDGLMFCRELRLRGHKEPIVVYSAGALPEDRKRGLAAGADAYVVKPDNSQLVGTVRMLLSRSDLPEAECLAHELQAQTTID